MCRSDGSLFVHSFAHGKSFYTLKYDAAAVEAAIKAADADAAMKTLVRLDPQAELDGVELDRLIELVVKRQRVEKSERSKPRRRKRAHRPPPPPKRKRPSGFLVNEPTRVPGSSNPAPMRLGAKYQRNTQRVHRNE